MVILLLRSTHVLITLIIVIVINLFHKTLLYHVKVIFATVKTKYRNLINPLPPFLFHLP